MTLQINALSFSYDKKKPVLDNISLSAKQGEILGILGPNGTGKTTLLKCLNKILVASSGEIIFDGLNLKELDAKAIAKLIAYVPQYSGDQFTMTVIDCVMLGRLPYASRSYSESDKALVFNILRQLNLEDFAFRGLNTLSGGERQRVFIARALAQEPKCIILDEPTSSLDLHNQLFTLHTLASIAREKNIALIMTIHDLNLASMFCDKILMLKNAQIFAYGPSQEVLTTSNIEAMYKVKTAVTTQDGYKHIRLLK